MISLNKAGSCRRLLILGVAAVTLSYSQSADAALISITDDGVNTTIAWSGSFDDSGLTLLTVVPGSLFGSSANFSSDSVFQGPDDVFLLNGVSSDSLSIFSGFDVSGSFDDPNGDTKDGVIGDSTGMFYLHGPLGSGGFFNSGDGSVLLSGSLVDNGFTAGQTLTFNNSNVGGDSGQIVLSTVAVPEPSSTLLVSLGGLALLLRRRK